MKAALLLTVCIAVSSACQRSSWERTAHLPESFTAETVIALGSGLSLVGGGEETAAGGTKADVASIFRVRGARLERTFVAPEGGVYGFAAYGSTTWALLRRETPEGKRKDVQLLVSRDRGRHWETVGPVPEHAGSLTATGPSDLWVLGVDTLIHSTDAGRTWQRLIAPPGSQSINWKVARLGSGKIALVGAGVLVLGDAGESFVRTVAEDVEVPCASGNTLVVRSQGTLRVGTLDDDGTLLPRTGTLPSDVEPFDLQADGPVVRVLALRGTSPLPLSGIALLESGDHGKSWKVSRVDAQAWSAFADLGPAGAGVAINLDGDVVAPR